MTLSTTLRPREKIHQRSIRILSDHELIQVIIGNGSPHHPVKQLARSVLKLASLGQAGYGDLLEIPGLGKAKAARLAASFELARRYAPDSIDIAQLMERLLTTTADTYATIAMISLDGAKRLIRSELVPIADIGDPSALQTLCRSLIINNALYVSIGMNNVPQVDATEFCRQSYRAFRAIGVTLLNFRWGEANERILYAA